MTQSRGATATGVRPTVGMNNLERLADPVRAVLLGSDGAEPGAICVPSNSTSVMLPRDLSSDIMGVGARRSRPPHRV